MKRRMITTSSDGSHEEVDYSSLSDAEIDRRLRGYERRYGVTLKTYLGGYSCSNAGHEEVFDLLDWETLEEERRDRAEALARTKP